MKAASHTNTLDDAAKEALEALAGNPEAQHWVNQIAQGGTP